MGRIWMFWFADLPSDVEACVEDNMEATARLADEETHSLTYMVRSLAKLSDNPCVLAEPGRDRGLSVLDEQSRSYQGRRAPALKRCRLPEMPPCSQGSLIAAGSE